MEIVHTSISKRKYRKKKKKTITCVKAQSNTSEKECCKQVQKQVKYFFILSILLQL
jgi:hypothetical protein